MNPRSCRKAAARVARVLAVPFSILAAASGARADVVTFDTVAADPGGTIFAGNTFSAKGVSFLSVNSPNGLAVGQTITLSNADPRLLVLGNSDSVSAPNFAAASGVFANYGPDDLLMTFSSPVTSVQLATDQNPGETADLVRLLALAPTSTPMKFVVVALASGSDAATTSPFNVLSLNLSGSPVSHVLFQTLTEAEGIDNLIFAYQPDCSRRSGIDVLCYEVPPYKSYIPVGCEIVDCCPFCPGRIVDWEIYADGDPFDKLVLQFEDLSREVAAGMTVEGAARWMADTQQLEIYGGGKVVLRGLAAEGKDLRWSAASPRMTLSSIEAREGAAGRAVRVKVHQKVGEVGISDSTLVYQY
jgi:hypothetical protein